MNDSQFELISSYFKEIQGAFICISVSLLLILVVFCFVGATYIASYCDKERRYKDKLFRQDVEDIVRGIKDER